MLAFPRKTAMKYGRPLSTSDEPAHDEPPPLTWPDVKLSLWERWWRGMVILGCLSGLAALINCAGFVIGAEQWSRPMQTALGVVLLIAVFVGAPIVIYQIAFDFVARPWYRKAVKTSRAAPPPSDRA
jgi:hypothetical protein